MLKTIHNDRLKLTVDTLGAQMMSIESADGCEYLWQGDPAYWEDRSPTLFPFIGRLTNNSYCHNGMVYPMGIHGFAASMEFETVQHLKDKLTLRLCSDATTQRIYPFEFVLDITFTLCGNSIAVTFKVANLSGEVMPFAIGGHPGFRVPLVDGECFEDYVLEFAEECSPLRVGFTEQIYLSGEDVPYPLTDDKYISLRHDLFDEDAIILKDMARAVTLRCVKSQRAVTVSYPNMPYVGFWHWPKTDAPYVCIEPWSSLPSRQDIVEDFRSKEDMLQLEAGGVYENTWTITVL